MLFGRIAEAGILTISLVVLAAFATGSFPAAMPTGQLRIVVHTRPAAAPM